MSNTDLTDDSRGCFLFIQSLQYELKYQLAHLISLAFLTYRFACLLLPGVDQNAGRLLHCACRLCFPLEDQKEGMDT